MNSKFINVALWLVRIVTAVILLQTLFFKFTAAEESVYIFSTIGMEPWGRFGSGVLELVASILILVPATTLYGAILSACLMMGAIFFHLTKLGISVQNDGGLLFIYAVIVLFCSVVLVISNRKQWSKVTTDVFNFFA